MNQTIDFSKFRTLPKINHRQIVFVMGSPLHQGETEFVMSIIVTLAARQGSWAPVSLDMFNEWIDCHQTTSRAEAYKALYHLVDDATITVIEQNGNMILPLPRFAESINSAILDVRDA